MIAAACAVLLVLGWQMLGWLGWLPVVVPAPLAILATVPRSGGAFLLHAGPTLATASTGFLLALVVALMLGVLSSIVRQLGPALSAAGIALDSVPLIAMTPVLTVLLGVGGSARVMIAALACFLPLLLGVLRGAESADRTADELFHVLAASRTTRLRLLLLPSALPFILSAFKIAAPAALLGALVAEWAGAERGLGIMMTYAMFAFDVPQLWLAILGTCALSLALYTAMAGFERVVLSRWG